MLSGLFLLAVACKSDNAESALEKNTKALTATAWTNPTVTNTPDGDLSDSYNNFVVLFTQQASGTYHGTFVISNGGYAFEENTGKWKFSDDLKQIVFDSGKTMNVTVDDKHLHLDFTVAPPTGGRTDGLSGNFVFEFTH